MQNLNVSSTGCCGGQQPLKKCGPDWAVPEGGVSPPELPDRGPRELDKWGVLMDSVKGASQLDHTGARGEVPRALPRPGVWRQRAATLKLKDPERRRLISQMAAFLPPFHLVLVICNSDPVSPHVCQVAPRGEG